MVKRKNWLKDFLSKKIQVPVTYGTAAGAMSGSSANIPKVESTVGRTLLEAAPAAAIVAAPVVASSAPAITHGLQVMANPALAKTTAGAIGATALDASGLVASVEGLKDTERKIKNHEYTAKDVPMTILSGMGLLPGASVLTRQENIMPIVKGVSNMLKDDLAATKLLLSGKYQPTFGIIPDNLKMRELPTEQFLNEHYAVSPSSKQNAFSDAIKKRIRFDYKNNVPDNVHKGDFLDLVELEGQEDVPFFIRDNNGTFRYIRGNIGEKTKTRKELINGNIDPSLQLISRAKGFEPEPSFLFVGEGDWPVVSNYLLKRYTDKLHYSFDPIYFKSKDPKRFEKLATNLRDFAEKNLATLNRSYDKGDIELAADAFTDLLKVPEASIESYPQRMKMFQHAGGIDGYNKDFLKWISDPSNRIPGRTLDEKIRSFFAKGERNDSMLELFKRPFNQDGTIAIDFGPVDFSGIRHDLFPSDLKHFWDVRTTGDNGSKFIQSFYLSPNAKTKILPDMTNWNVRGELERKQVVDLLKQLGFSEKGFEKGVQGDRLMKAAHELFPDVTGFRVRVNDFNGLRMRNGDNPIMMGIPGVHSQNLVEVGKFGSYKDGGVVKAQNGWVLDKWQKAYNSKFGKGLRDFLYGQDRDLSDKEYLKKHGYNKPVGGIGVLGALVAPEWEGLEAPVVAENFGRAGYIKATPWTARLKYTKPTNPSGFPKTQQLSNLDKFLQKSVQEQNDIVRYWNGERFSNLQQLQRNPQQYKLFQHWLDKQ